MARKSASQGGQERASAEALGQSVVDSAQRIWLAGLGAFSRAKTEGDSMFNVLVEQGKGLRERARGAADQAVRTIRTQADATVGQAQGQWDKLEQVFEDRVSRSLNRLGVLTRQEVDDLARQVEELNDSVRQLLRAQGAGARGAARGGARKATATKARRGTKKKAARKPRA
jgi:poly(hydroxyalkanoate) granule-associated protein